MTLLKFFVDAGNEAFAPTVSHPGEDAGADIRAFTKEDYSRDAAEEFYKRFKKPIRNGIHDLYIDGNKYELDTLDAFLEEVEVTGGAIFLAPGETKIINSGFKVIMQRLDDLGAPWNQLLPVYKIMSRSGLACKHNIVVTNAPGIIDLGYQDWVKVSLTNQGKSLHVFTHGARIAQGLHEFVFDQQSAEITTEQSDFSDTLRSTGGFGSTSVA